MLRSRAARLIVCSLTGIAFGVAAPPRSLAWLSWLAVIPTLWVLRMPGVGARESLLLGLVSAVGVGMVGFAWIGETLVNFGGFPVLLGILGLLVYSVWMAVPYAFLGLAVHLGPRDGLPSALWLVVAFVGLTHTWPVVFPYTAFIGLIQTPEWIQIAELGGVALIEAHVLIAVWLAVRALESGPLRVRVACATLALAVPALSLVGGALRMEQIDRAAAQARTTRVGIVQPNVPVLFGNAPALLERLWGASARAQSEGAEWIVWPEAATYPYALERPVRAEPELEEARVLARHSTPTIFGAVTLDDGPLPYNTLLHMDATGRVKGIFDKTELVPFGESVPLVDPDWLQSWIPAVRQLRRGAGPARFVVEPSPGSSVSVGPLICYEDIIPEFTREVAAQAGGIEVFVNATIDGWYGASSEPWEHLALAQVRSVEHRIPMVRAVSSGVSSVIDASGRLVAYLPARASDPGGPPPADPEILVYALPLARDTASAPTWFARAGFVGPSLCRLGLLAGLLILGLRHLRARRGQPRHQPPDHPRLDVER